MSNIFNRSIQHPYYGIYQLCIHTLQFFKKEHFNSEQKNNRNVNKKGPVLSIASIIIYFILLLIILLFLFITSIYGLYYSIKCNHTFWFVLNLFGLFTGIPFGTIYYFFISCS